MHWYAKLSEKIAKIRNIARKYAKNTLFCYVWNKVCDKQNLHIRSLRLRADYVFLSLLIGGFFFDAFFPSKAAVSEYQMSENAAPLRTSESSFFKNIVLPAVRFWPYSVFARYISVKKYFEILFHSVKGKIFYSISGLLGKKNKRVHQ